MDPMAPRAGATPTLCGPLELVTLMANELEPAVRFLTQAMRLRIAGDVELHGADAGAAARRELWGLPAAARWRELTFEAASEPPGVRVRVIAMPGGAPIRPGMESRLTGGLSIGFPAADLALTLSRVTALGYESTAGIVPLTITRPDGSSYVSGEILFRGPEQSYMLVVGRPAGMAPVGPIDAATGMGGAAYSAIVVPDATREIAFYRDVLGWEARQDIVLTTSGPAGGLGLDPGTQFRFVQLFAPGAASGYVCLLDMMAAGRANPVAPRLPNRGLVMWSFGTQSFDRVLARARAAASDSSAPRLADLAGRRTLTMLTPAGVMIEITDRG
ncbi:MAG: VOC family protein [Steroidobacteraceae bacterium]|nr:VOC family protein [Steroidobacteraceae bacterium]